MSARRRLDWLPAPLRSLKFRLALTYSVLVFGLAAVVVGGVNVALSRQLDEYPVSTQTQFRTFVTPDGRVVTIEESVRGRFVTLEQLVNRRALDSLRRISLYALLGLFPASVVIGWLVADRALRPISRIAEVAEEIQATDLSRRIGSTGVDDELQRLAGTFDAMLDRVEAGVEEQRRFIQDTSHELRNPLAVMATTLDVTLADPEADVDDLRRAAEVVRRTVDRTSRTVDDLIAYARREAPTAARGPVDLGEVVDEVVAEFAGPVESMALVVERVGPGVVVDADRDALKRAFANLVGNAVRVSHPAGRLVYGAGGDDTWAWLGIADEGPGIRPEDHEAVFSRHVSKHDARIVDEPRSGLGLAIVRQIVESHGGVVTLRSTPGRGSSFVIWLPRRADADVGAVTADGVHPVRDPLVGGRLG